VLPEVGCNWATLKEVKSNHKQTTLKGKIQPQEDYCEGGKIQHGDNHEGGKIQPQSDYCEGGKIQLQEDYSEG
jgi:hypothetical protein